MGLLPLEFTECLTDSPYFREKLHAHEKELDRTSQAIKGLIREVKELLGAAKNLSRAQRSLANTLMNFKFECIGNSQTDDEIVIAGSLKEFGRLLSAIEDERDRMLEHSQVCFIDPIESFRKDQIGGAKEIKKKFDKETAKFCQSMERHLNLSSKKTESQLQEADASLELEQRHFFQASLDYIFLLQEVQEKKKFEFVETLLRFMYGWLTFYHQGHEVAKDFKSYLTDLQIRLQRTRENFVATHDEAEQLKQKMLEKPTDPGSLNKMYTRQGYLFLMEKKKLSTTWSKNFCMYQKTNKKFTMIPYSQPTGKISTTETLILNECIRKSLDSIDRRFCFDIIPEDKPATFTFQALSEIDYKLWLDAMGGKEPTYFSPGRTTKQEEYLLDDIGFEFVQKCIEIVESRGLHDQGLYRLVGVNSKVAKLTQMALDRRKNQMNFENSDDCEIKTITSALKNYFRNLPEPVMTFRLHSAFITAAKNENKIQRVNLIHSLVHKLPKNNFKMLNILIKHLCKVAQYSDKNLMTVSNLGVCFGPTLLRPEVETMAAIMDIKFGNVVVEILIENWNKFTVKQREDSCLKIIFSSIQEENHKRPEIPYYTSPTVVKIPSNFISPTHQESMNIRKSIQDDQSSDSSRVLNIPKIHHSNLCSPCPPPYLNDGNHSIQRGMLTHPAYVISPIQATSVDHSVGQCHSIQTHIPVDRGRAVAVFNPAWNDNHSPSTASSSESLANPQTVSRSLNNSSHSSSVQMTSKISPPIGSHIYVPPNNIHETGRSEYSRNNIQENYEIQGYNIQETQDRYINNGMQQSGIMAKTLYACVGENESELSFQPNEIIYNLRSSNEQGWLIGVINGREGMIPANYVEFL